jgi:uncharacterized protein YwgA
MTSSDRASIVLYAMQCLKNEGSWSGETHVQKALYLCQELMKVPSDFKFILYKHGPYSFDLSAHLQGLIADDLVCVLAKQPYGPSLRVSNDGQSVASETGQNSGLAERIGFMAKKLGGKGVADLEKLATAVYVNRKYGVQTPIAKRVQLLTSLKPHVPTEEAQEAFSEAKTIEEEVSRAFA